MKIDNPDTITTSTSQVNINVVRVETEAKVAREAVDIKVAVVDVIESLLIKNATKKTSKTNTRVCGLRRNLQL
jgi:hypothetical protein